MELTDRQREALEAICDTFCPPVNGTPAASELGVARAVVEAVALNPRESERKQLQQLLGLWDNPLLSAIAGGGLHRFSSLSREEREKVLLSWCDSRVPQRRAAFQALRKGALLFYYMLPGADGGRNKAWDEIDYPGPLGKLESAPPKALKPLAIEGDTDLDCDVVIVGSGAGGGATAGVLAAEGLDVIVLESGDYYDDEDFAGSEYDSITSMYMAAPAATEDQSVGLLGGSCLGGGTVINYSTSFKTPDDVREEWAAYGVPAFTSDEYARSMDAVVERLGVNQENNEPSSRERKLQEGCVKLGWHVDAMPRNVKGCDLGKECGYCGLGCRIGAKRSVVKTWLADAFEAGSRLIVRTRVQKVVIEAGVARGVEAKTVEGHRVSVKAKSVVVACGALHTPALLKRSGLTNPNIGRHLKLHPATVAWGVFDDEIKPWEGAMQALYSDQHRYLHGNYGVKYETAPAHPHLIVPFAPWRGGRSHHELMQALSHTAPMGILLRDRDGGEVKVSKDGEPVVRYKLSAFDTQHIRAGYEGAAQIFEAAGARRIYSSHSKWVSYDPGTKGSREQFMRDADACGYGAGQNQMGSFHIMGSCRMGGSPATSACNPTGETWEVRGLYVSDGSSFPTASGVNPQVSIQSIAHMNARGMAARL
ncbi:MAG: GMC family oxidoreductase N-terminal domain-containing protein [Solirubrobacteraceae bacterium]